MRKLILTLALLPALAACHDDDKAKAEQRAHEGALVYQACVLRAMAWRQVSPTPAERVRFASDEQSYIANICPLVRDGADYPESIPYPGEDALRRDVIVPWWINRHDR
jgi:hypothetical protein